MIETISFKDKSYPKLTSEGFAAQYAFPFADKLLKGFGFDIGCNRNEWALPSIPGRKVYPVDPVINPEYDAFHLPSWQPIDFIFSSHCLEHLTDWVGALDYWKTTLKDDGILFLYLPHAKQEYWMPFFNRKHIHSLSPEIIKQYLIAREWKNIFVTENDLNYSFYAVAQK